jgi:ElaB/YqjD/DUF883 family membrane-anchored ribosome-binding protein
MIKSDFLLFLNQHIQAEVEQIQHELSLISADLANDTKSSAGDKFETAREMANQEINKLQTVLHDKKRFLQLLQSESFSKTHSTIQSGTLVQISGNWYFFGVPFGKLMYKKKQVLGIGLTAPFAQAFLQKVVDSTIVFGGNELIIEQIS